ncbi:MAG: hypothetical protein IIA67_02690 [Planctomycetes bacterium]|nr:hypothetical protein [Planctomycetota bacterium]
MSCRPRRPANVEQPIEVTLSVRESAEESVIEQLQFRSEFVAIQASGRLDDLTASADFDLQRLVEQISQVVDLGGLRLAGRGRGQFHIRRTGEADFTASGRIDLARFRLSAPQQRSWTEERVTVTLDAAGEIVDGRPTRLRSAIAKVILGDERLVARLATPVADIRTQANWPLQLRMTTRLAPWLPRLDPWLSLPALSAEGDCRFNALVDFSSSGVLVRESHLEIDRLRVTTEGLRVVEPHVDLRLAGQWEFASGNLKVHSADLQSGVLSVASKDFSIGHDEAGRWQLAGGIQFQADAARLQNWFSEGRKTPAAYELAGRLSGELQLASRDGPTSADLEIVAEDMLLVRRTQPIASAAPLVVRPAGNTPPRAPVVPNVNHLREPPRAAQARSSQTLWREAKAVLKITSRYDPASDVLEIESVDLVGSALHLQGAGSIAAVASRRQLKLSGQLDYDLSKFSPLLQVYAGSGIKIAGRNTGTFSLAGPLTAPEASRPAGTSSGSPARSWIESITADVQLGWREIDFYGLKAEHGTLQVKLSGGQITVAPLDLKVNQGRVTAAPAVRLTGKHAVLLLGKGPLARDIVLTKEVCAGGLKYIAPVVADAVDAQGRFSIDLDGASVPLSAPEETKLSGRLTVHTIKLTPGPLTGQFLQLAGRLETIFRGGGLAGRVADTTVTMRENQQVEFRMAHGRIYHQGLELIAAGAVIRTSGSVGIDETLDLVVELPIQEKWIGRDSRLAPWRNRVIRIPIRGTLSRPKVDARVLGDLAAHLARQAGQKFLQDQINKRLEKLLQPRGPS